MKITNIKQQVKRADRYSIYIDGKYSFSLSEADLASTGLHKDQELDEKELEDLLNESQKGKAYDRCLRYITIRPRSQWEVEDYLKRKEYSPDVIATVLQKLLKLELVNDHKFAEQWVGWRSQRSKRQLYAELLKKRVDKEIINSVLQNINESDELEQIKELVARKGKLSQYQDQQKLIAFLARRGFPYHLIKKATDKNQN
jgi:regulatory protein